MSIWQVYINWMNFVVNLLLPLVLLGFLNVRIYRNMPRLGQGPVYIPKPVNMMANGVNDGSALNEEAVNKHKALEQERDTRYTRASIFMVMVFLICHVPRFVTNVIELLMFHGNIAEVQSSGVSKTSFGEGVFLKPLF